MLTRHVAPGLSSYHEGNGDENSSGLWQRARGWDRIPHVTPHGWTDAELLLSCHSEVIGTTRLG